MIEDIANTDQPNAIVSLLVARGIINDQIRERAEIAADRTGDRVDAVLVKLGLASEDAVADAYAIELGLARASIAELEPAPFENLDTGFLRSSRVIPTRDKLGELVIVTADPLDGYPLRLLRKRLGGFRVAVGTAREVERLIESASQGAVHNDASDLGDGDADVAKLAEFSSDAPVIRYVAGLFEQAVDSGASDIHLALNMAQPHAKLRRDGVLVSTTAPPAAMFAAVIARIKILAGLDIAEQRRPQDGRIRTAVGGRDIDLRVSILPVTEGESAVLRILDRARSPAGLADLNLEPADRLAIEALLRSSNGLVLITGPTGSGKTTTIAAMLAEIASPERHLVSVEDPIEIRVAGVTQIQVAPAIGLTFPAILRSVLRHDPDVVTIGEIRDGETARIAINAALTGHLVLATLHTNSASSAVARLADMGIEPFLIAATLRGVLAQRLLRRACQPCAGSSNCSACGGSGYAGRFAILEHFVVDEDMAQAIGRGESSHQLEERARSRGFASLREGGARFVRSGVTTEAELTRALGAS